MNARIRTKTVLALAAVAMVTLLASTAQVRAATITITDPNTGFEWTVLNDEAVNDASGSVVRTGTWTRLVVGGNAFNGIEYRAAAATEAGTPDATNTWTFLDLIQGSYEVGASWKPASSGSNSPFSINGGSAILVDQTSTPAGPPNLDDLGGAGIPAINAIGYQLLSTNATVGGTETLTVLLTNDANGQVIADSIAIRLVAGAPVCNPVDFDGNGDVDIDDLNALTAVGDLTVGVAQTPANAKYDLICDNTIDTADLDQWLTDAATINGFGSPYLLGDANLDGDVDVFQLDGNGDAQILTSNLSTTSGAVWGDGDFNADGDVDAFEFGGGGDAQLLTSNIGSFSDIGAAAVPEPSTLILSALSLLGLLGFGRRRRRQAA